MAEMDALIAFGVGIFVVVAYIVDHKLKSGKFKISATIRRGVLILRRGVGTILIKMLPNVSGGVVRVAKKVKSR
jgi:hypothetical protein